MAVTATDQQVRFAYYPYAALPRPSSAARIADSSLGSISHSPRSCCCRQARFVD
jgi:hypothetical protein